MHRRRRSRGGHGREGCGVESGRGEGVWVVVVGVLGMYLYIPGRDMERGSGLISEVCRFVWVLRRGMGLLMGGSRSEVCGEGWEEGGGECGGLGTFESEMYDCLPYAFDRIEF